MKNAVRSLIPALLGSATAAYAADGAQSGGTSLLLIAFLAFFALIVVFQMIPGLLMFFSMLRGVFSSAARKKTVVAGADTEKPS